MTNCIDHLNFLNDKCLDCDLDVDAYGNTESQFNFCSFPDCGCDGERLCMAGNANENAKKINVEGMWNSKSPKAKKAIADLIGLIKKPPIEE